MSQVAVNITTMENLTSGRFIGIKSGLFERIAVNIGRRNFAQSWEILAGSGGHKQFLNLIHGQLTVNRSFQLSQCVPNTGNLRSGAFNLK